MKNWVYMSMSLLVGMAVGPQAEGTNAVPSGDTLSAEEISKCIGRLNLDKAPGLRDASPCYSSTK